MLQGHFFIVAAEFWERWYPEDPTRDRLLRGWTEAFHNEYFKNVYKFCTISFKDNRMYPGPKKRKNRFFVSIAKLRSCTLFKFVLKEPIVHPHVQHEVHTY